MGGPDAVGDVDPRWDDPDSYDQSQSHDEAGRYPPDWPARRAAVRHRQDDTCGRCRRSPPDVSLHVHHLRFLSEGGSNDLSNLVALCRDCHSLMHPENYDLSGQWWTAPMFPDPDADPRVAVIRVPATNDERAEYGDDLVSLAATGDLPTANRRAVSNATVPVSVGESTGAAMDLDRLLRGRRFEPDDDEGLLHVRVVSPDYRTVVTDVTVTVHTDPRTVLDTDDDGRVTVSYPGEYASVYVESDVETDRQGWLKIGGTRLRRMGVVTDDHATHVLRRRRPGAEGTESTSDQTTEDEDTQETDPDGPQRDEQPTTGPDPEPTPEEPEVDTVEAAVYLAGILVAAVLGNGYADLGLSGAVGGGMLAAVFLSPLIADPED